MVRAHMGKKTSKKHDVFLDKVGKKKISNSFNNKQKTMRCNRFIFVKEKKKKKKLKEEEKGEKLSKHQYIKLSSTL